MANPWDNDPIVGQAPPASATPGVLGTIPGRVDPYKVQNQAQDLTKGGLDIEGKRLDITSKQLEIEERRLKMSEGEKAEKAAEGAKAAAGFYRRALNAHQGYGEGVAPRAPIVDDIVEALPDSLERGFSSDQRKNADTYAAEFIAATLRKESGAAISPQEFQSQYARYFPQPGDGPEQMQIKRQLREQALEAIRDQAGNLVDAPTTPVTLTDEQAREELRQRVARGDKAADTISWLLSIQRPPTQEQIDAIIANEGNRNPKVGEYEGEHPYWRSFKVGLGGVAEGVGDVLGLVSDPFVAGVNAATGSNLTPDLGTNLRELFGLPAPESNQELLVSAVNRGGTAALSGAGLARGIASGVTGVAQNALGRFASAPLTDMAAGSSAAASAELARQAGAPPAVQLGAGLVGGAASLPVAGRVNALMGAPPRPVSQLAQAGQAEGVTVNRAMLDPRVQNRVTGVEATMAGGPMVRGAMNRVGSQIEERVQALGQGGQALDESVAGQTVQTAAKRFIETSGREAKRLYDRAEQASAGVKVAPVKSNAILDEMIGRLSETANTNSAEIAFLQGLKGDFSKSLSVGALRDIRTTLRKKIAKGELTFGQNEARVLEIMDAAADDIASGLAAAGKRGAAAMFKRADEQYAQRMDFIKNTIQRVVGKRDANLPPEKVFSNLKAMASPKGDAAGLARMMRSMDPDEQVDIAATFADALGKNGKGEFSTAHFLSQVEKLPRSARVNVFGPQGARSIDNLVVLAKEHARVTGGFNSSRTGVANDYRSWLANLVFGGGTGLVTESGLAALGAAAGGMAVKSGRDVVNARLLMSPNVQKWLRSAPRSTDPKAINSHFDRLKALATREPAISEEINQLGQAIMRAANENAAAPAAASVRSDQDDR